MGLGLYWVLGLLGRGVYIIWKGVRQEVEEDRGASTISRGYEIGWRQTDEVCLCVVCLGNRKSSVQMPWKGECAKRQSQSHDPREGGFV